MWGPADNTILYGMEARDVYAQSVFLQPTYQPTPGSPRYQLANSALVDLDIENEMVLRDGQNVGGPPFSQMQSSFSHVLFRDLKLPNQRFGLRTDFNDPAVTNQWFEAQNVLFENCEFHRETCVPTVRLRPHGLQACCVDCTYAAPLKTNEDSGVR